MWVLRVTEARGSVLEVYVSGGLIQKLVVVCLVCSKSLVYDGIWDQETSEEDAQFIFRYLAI